LWRNEIVFDYVGHLGDIFGFFFPRLELDVPRPLGFDVGYWGAPAALGQGTLVLEPVARNARSTVQWYKSTSIFSTVFFLLAVSTSRL
jgi:hypothetical protein